MGSPLRMSSERNYQSVNDILPLYMDSPVPIALLDYVALSVSPFFLNLPLR